MGHPELRSRSRSPLPVRPVLAPVTQHPPQAVAARAHQQLGQQRQHEHERRGGTCTVSTGARILRSTARRLPLWRWRWLRLARHHGHDRGRVARHFRMPTATMIPVAAPPAASSSSLLWDYARGLTRAELHRATADTDDSADDIALTSACIHGKRLAA